MQKWLLIEHAIGFPVLQVVSPGSSISLSVRHTSHCFKISGQSQPAPRRAPHGPSFFALGACYQ